MAFSVPLAALLAADADGAANEHDGQQRGEQSSDEMRQAQQSSDFGTLGQTQARTALKTPSRGCPSASAHSASLLFQSFAATVFAHPRAHFRRCLAAIAASGWKEN